MGGCQLLPVGSPLQHLRPLVPCSNNPRVSVAGTRQANWERNTWPELSRLASDVPEAAVHFQGEYFVTGRSVARRTPARIDDRQRTGITCGPRTPILPSASGSRSCRIRVLGSRTRFRTYVPSSLFHSHSTPAPPFRSLFHSFPAPTPPSSGGAAFLSLFPISSTSRTHLHSTPQFRPLPASSLGSYDFGTAFTTVCINTAIYLPYLASQCLAAGVKLKRAAFAHLSDAATAHVSGQPAHLLVNCTGLGARKLGGVEDANVVPARGQTVLVRNESPGIGADSSGTDDGEEELAYVIQRAAGELC